MALVIIERIVTTLQDAPAPLSGRDVRTLTCGHDNALQGALRALWSEGLVIAALRRGAGGGMAYVLPQHHTTHLGDNIMNTTPITEPLIAIGAVLMPTEYGTGTFRVHVHEYAEGARIYYLPELDVAYTEDEAEHLGGGFPELVAKAKTTPARSITFDYIY